MHSHWESGNEKRKSKVKAQSFMAKVECLDMQIYCPALTQRTYSLPDLLLRLALP